MVAGISVVYLYVRDLERALWFFRDRLGIPLEQEDGTWAEASTSASASTMWTRPPPACVRRLVALLACAALAACGGSNEEDRPRQVGQSAGLEVYGVASQGFSIGVPPDWRVISVDEALPEGEREQLSRENPDFAPLLEAISSGEQPIKLFAFDPDVQDAFATNVNVVAVDLPSGTTLAQFVEANKADIEAFGARVGAMESAPAQLPSGPAERLAYRLRLTTGGRRQTVATLQYLLVGGDKGYVVTFSTLPDLSDRYGPVFDRTIRSLSLD